MKRKQGYNDHIMARSHFEKALAWIVRRPLPVLAVIALMTVFFAWKLPHLRIGTSIYDLVIENLPETRQYQTFKKNFESDEIIRIVIRSKNVFDPHTFEVIEKLSDAASRIKGVRRVIGLPDIRRTVGRTEKWTLKQFADFLAPVSLFQRNLISKDQRSTILTLVLDKQASSKEVLEKVEDLIRHVPAGLTVYQTGLPLVSDALAGYTALDFKRLPPVTLVVIALILFLLFRNVACLVLPLMTVILSQIWTFGLMAWLGIPLSMMTMIVPIFLIAVGTAYCLHICSEYMKCDKDVSSAKEAVYNAVRLLTFPTVLAVVTTIIGLGSLFINRIEAIREFALFSCFGMVSLLFIMLTAFPAAMTFFPIPSRERMPPLRGLPGLDRFFQKLLGKIIAINIRRQRTTFFLLIVLILFCGAGIFRIRVETNPVEYFKRDAPVSRYFHDIYRDLSGSFPMNVLLSGGGEDFFEDIKNIREIARLQEYLETLPGVDKTISFADYLKLVNYTLNRYDPKYYSLPEEAFELRMLINNYKSLLGEDMLLRFMKPDFSLTNILMLTHISSSRDFLETKEKILDKVKADFPDTLKCEVTGLGVAISASSDLLTSGQVKSLSITLLLIFMVMILLFLSAKVGLVAIAVNLFPIVVSFGLMGWLNVHLSVVTSLIASIAIGLAVDDTIHYLFRYNNEFRKDPDKDRALTNTILSVGRPMIFTTLTISCGFSILLFSHFAPTSLFGLMMIITMIAALVGDIIILPALMLHVELVTAWDLLKWIPTMSGMPPGVAHEIRQPLNAIKLGNDFLKMMLKKGKPISEQQLNNVVHEIDRQVDRASGIITRLIEIGQGPTLESEPVDINRPIRETLGVVENELHLENIVIKTDLEDGLPPIMGNKRRLAQIFFSVLTNAREAIHEKIQTDPEVRNGVIEIKTFREGNRVVALVTDSGVGIPPYAKDRIFEPFFSSKEKGKGLGLAISRQIIKAHGGKIEVKSEVGVGTTIKISFPLTLM